MAIQNTKKRIRPCIIQPKITGGMCYVVQLINESFIVIDGGEYHDEDLKCLYKLLLERTSDGKKPVISAWMFTHPHHDHIGLATEFIRQMSETIDIRAYMYQFPNCAEMNTQEDDDKIQEDIDRLERNIAEYYPVAKIHTLHMGQIYNFEGVEIEILITGEDIYPYQAAHYNDVSAAWRMKFDNGKTFLVLGDCFTYSCRKLRDTYGSYLKSDILSLAHHGLIGGDKRLYQLIDPDICLWAISEGRFTGESDKIRYCLGEGGCDYNAWIRDNSIRRREHYHHSVTTVLKM